MAKGVIYVAYDPGAIREAGLGLESLKRHHPDWPVSVIGEQPLPGAGYIHQEHLAGTTPGRWAKVNLDKLTPYEPTLFLDADTRVNGRLDVGFDLLAAGWELVMVPSISQGADALAHLSEPERQITFDAAPGALQLNTGVMWFRKTRAVTALFAAWREEWEHFRDKDQGALLRALVEHPVKLFLLGQAYNGGTIVQHRFGACRRG